MNDSAKRPRLLANLKKLSILTLIASACLGVSSCPNNAPDFKWNPPIYSADARAQVIVRKNDRIRCSDRRFDEFVCTYASEIPKAKQAAYDVINQCERWRPNANPYELVETLEVMEQEAGGFYE